MSEDYSWFTRALRGEPEREDYSWFTSALAGAAPGGGPHLVDVDALRGEYGAMLGARARRRAGNAGRREAGWAAYQAGPQLQRGPGVPAGCTPAGCSPLVAAMFCEEPDWGVY